MKISAIEAELKEVTINLKHGDSVVEQTLIFQIEGGVDISVFDQRLSATEQIIKKSEVGKIFSLQLSLLELGISPSEGKTSRIIPGDDIRHHKAILIGQIVGIIDGNLIPEFKQGGRFVYLIHCGPGIIYMNSGKEYKIGEQKEIKGRLDLISAIEIIRTR